jgi:hypothetical protein
MKVKWIFKDGTRTTEFESFPFAYRAMWNTLKRGVESKTRKYEDMVKGFSITSPLKDRDGHARVYSYATATVMATDLGVLTPDGQLNSREFRH